MRASASSITKVAFVSYPRDKTEQRAFDEATWRTTMEVEIQEEKKKGGNQSKRRPVQRLTNTLKVKALPPFAIVFASDLQTLVPIVTIHLTHQQP